jgi:hypothetical protein
LLALVGCARVIGLGNDYYLNEVGGGLSGGEGGADAGGGGGGNAAGGGNASGGGDTAGSGDTSSSGSGGNGANAGSGGAAGMGIMDGPLCLEHPVTPRAKWVASASNQNGGNPPSNLIDNSSARWSTGKPQAGNEWLQIDFGATVTLRSINLQQGQATDSNDYPRMYSVIVSEMDKNLMGSECASGVGTSGVSTTIVLPHPFSGRYLLIKQLGTSISWWSVEELEVSCFDTP